jgi:hypothetical protein
VGGIIRRELKERRVEEEGECGKIEGESGWVGRLRDRLVREEGGKLR